MKRYLVVSEDAGVYLGEFLGLGFFSEWESGGVDEAVTFESVELAKLAVEKLTLKDIRFVEVDTNNLYVNATEMPKYGLRDWMVC